MNNRTYGCLLVKREIKENENVNNIVGFEDAKRELMNKEDIMERLERAKRMLDSESDIVNEVNMVKLCPKDTFLLLMLMSGYINSQDDGTLTDEQQETFDSVWAEIETGLIPYYVKCNFGIDLPIPRNQMVDE